MIKRPMKGDAVDDFTVVRFPCIGFPKIDGFRCVLDRHPLTSRLSRFPNYFFHRNLSDVLPIGVVLDGEVVVGKKCGKGVLQRTSSGLTSANGEPDFHLWVFDAPMVEGHFEKRYAAAREFVEQLNHPSVHLLKGTLLRDYEQLTSYVELCLLTGYEGIITRSLEGPYKQGKSTLREQYMLKIKPFETHEGRVTGYYEEMKNTNEAKRETTGKLKRSSAKSGKLGKGTLGGLILADLKTGVPVRVGGGFTKAQREKLYPLAVRGELDGLLVRYKKQTVGEKDKPRHPTFDEFVDFRPEWDMTD